MRNEDIIVKNGKALRFGYTTGSCATAAAVAAAQMLITGVSVQSVCITLPTGKKVIFEVDNITITKHCAQCSVVKDAGDDPDVTHGIKIVATCQWCEAGVVLKGGVGVGTVTAKGLACEIGQPAINPVPKRMILQNVTQILQDNDYKNGVCITISVPEGERIAQKTFNPRLGIVGGISILGTTGIVEPMSEKALIDTIKIMIDRQKITSPDNIIITPGNYGSHHCKHVLKLNMENAVKCSNYIGETLDYLAYKQYKNILLVGHVGKLVKIAGGVMNTHSSVADCRMEILAAHTACAGATAEMVRIIMNAHTTDEVLLLLTQWGMGEQVLASIISKIIFQLDYRLKNTANIGVIMFGTGDETIAQSDNVPNLLQLFKGVQA